MKRSIVAALLTLSAALIVACSTTGATSSTATSTPATTPAPTATSPQDTASLAGAIYRGEASGAGNRAHVATAKAAVGYQVYVRPRGAPHWTGPVITDEYGRFVFSALAPGEYQARAYDGPVRVWEQIVTVPAVLGRIVARDITVGYYVKTADAGHVEAVLESLSFPYEHRTAQNSVPTNALSFGTGVSLSDVKSLATALVQAGVPIRSIRHFRDSSGPKAKLIEIFGDGYRTHDPIFTVNKINAALDFVHA